MLDDSVCKKLANTVLIFGENNFFNQNPTNMKVKFLLIALVTLFFACEKNSDSVSEKINAEGVLRSDVSFVKWNQMQDAMTLKIRKAIRNPEFYPILKRLSETQTEKDLIYVINKLGFESKEDYEKFAETRNNLMKGIKIKYSLNEEVLIQEIKGYNASLQKVENVVEPDLECIELANFSYDICVLNPGYGYGEPGILNDIYCWLQLAFRLEFSCGTGSLE